MDGHKLVPGSPRGGHWDVELLATRGQCWSTVWMKTLGGRTRCTGLSQRVLPCVRRALALASPAQREALGHLLFLQM